MSTATPTPDPCSPAARPIVDPGDPRAPRQALTPDVRPARCVPPTPALGDDGTEPHVRCRGGWRAADRPQHWRRAARLYVSNPRTDELLAYERVALRDSDRFAITAPTGQNDRAYPAHTTGRQRCTTGGRR